MSTPDDLGLRPVEPVSASERAELDFLRYEAAYLQQRLLEVKEELRATEHKLHEVEIERDTIRHERNVMSQDFRWTLERLANSPAGPLLRRTDGFRRLTETWGDPPT